MRANLAGRWRALAWLVMSVLVWGHASARADAPPRIDIEMHAERRCADAAQFSALLRARLAAGALRDSLPVRFVLHLAERPEGGVAAKLALMRGSSVIRRELEAGSCREALDALALVAALILDPTPAEPATKASGHAASPPRARSAEGTREQRSNSASTEPDASAVPAADEGGVAAPPESEAGAAAVNPSATPPNEADAVAASEPVPSAPPLRIETAAGVPGRVSARFGLFIGPLLATGLTPAVRPGATFGLAVGLLRERLELMLELDVRSIIPHRERSAQGTATITFLGAAAKLCAFGLFSRGRMALSGCGVAELGALMARGSATDAPIESRTLWTALGPALRFELRGSERYWLRLGGELPLPILRKRYILGETTVFSVPHVTFRGELVLGVRFL